MALPDGPVVLPFKAERLRWGLGRDRQLPSQDPHVYI